MLTYEEHIEAAMTRITNAASNTTITRNGEDITTTVLESLLATAFWSEHANGYEDAIYLFDELLESLTLC